MQPSRLVFLLLCLPGPTLAGVCTLIEDDAKRLACFDAAGHCASIESDGARLECFDRAYTITDSSAEQAADDLRRSGNRVTAEVSERSEPADRGGAARSSGVTVAASAPEDFGSRESADAPRQYIEATIVEIRTTELKIDYLRLDNGQVWREIGDSRIRFREGRGVTIVEGVLGSFDLRMEGNNRIAKVRRVR